MRNSIGVKAAGRCPTAASSEWLVGCTVPSMISDSGALTLRGFVIRANCLRQLPDPQHRGRGAAHSGVFRRSIQRAIALQPGVSDRHGYVLFAVHRIGDRKTIWDVVQPGTLPQHLAIALIKGTEIAIRRGG